MRIETRAYLRSLASEFQLERSESSVRIETVDAELFQFCVECVRTIGILSED